MIGSAPPIPPAHLSAGAALTDRRFRIVACGRTAADACPQGRTGSDTRCRIVHREPRPPAEPLFVENGSHRAIVAEHNDELYLAVGDGQGARAIFLDPARACSIAGELIAGAARILARQFEQDRGSP